MVRLTVGAPVSPTAASANDVTRSWNDANSNFVPDCDLYPFQANGECGIVSNLLFGSASLTGANYDNDLITGFNHRQNNWEVTASVQHELMQGVAVDVGYFRRIWSNFQVTDNVLTTAADYTRFSYTAPANALLPNGGGYQICGLYDIKPAKFGLSDSLITKASVFGDLTQVYDGFDMSLNTRFKGGRMLAGGVSPQCLDVRSFKAPSALELSHDFLWRVHAAVPAHGRIGIFNRSHYEDVLVARVRKFAPAPEIEARYEQINAFEKTLTENGTTILKFMLHISKDEQKTRLQARLDEREHRWKFNPGDIGDRKLWNEYQHAYELMLQRCSTSWAPWYVIPSDHKWARNAAVATIVRETLEEMNPQYPKPDWKPKDYVIP